MSKKWEVNRCLSVVKSTIFLKNALILETYGVRKYIFKKDKPCFYIRLFSKVMSEAVLRIWNVYPGSEFFPFLIRIKEFKYFNPKKMVSKLLEI